MDRRCLVSQFTGWLIASALAPLTLSAQEPAAIPAVEYSTQTSSGEVSLSVSPQWEADELSFEIAANTHSVDLSQLRLDDLVKLVVRDTARDPSFAGSLRGHHARAVVRFTLPSRPDDFVLEISDVPDVPLRRLVWPLTSGEPSSDQEQRAGPEEESNPAAHSPPGDPGSP